MGAARERRLTPLACDRVLQGSGAAEAQKAAAQKLAAKQAAAEQAAAEQAAAEEAAAQKAAAQKLAAEQAAAEKAAKEKAAKEKAAKEKAAKEKAAKEKAAKEAAEVDELQAMFAAGPPSHRPSHRPSTAAQWLQGLFGAGPPSHRDGERVSHSNPKQQQQVRFADVQDEPLEILGPIVGVMKAPRLSLQEAAAATGVEDVDVHAFLAAEQAAQIVAKDSLNLDGDEVGSIYLYTMESELYPTLNRLLRQRDRLKLKPFFPYLQLMLRARRKLPRYIGSVWRGVRGVDLREKYPKGKEFYWWAFSSTTKQLETLTNPQFLGKKGVRTVFMIEVRAGVDIESFSAFQDEASEAEVLLYPGTKLQVVGSIDMGQGLFQVHLREVEVPMELVK